MLDFPEDVKRDEKVFLQQLHLQSRVRFLFEIMFIFVRKPVERTRTFLIEHNRVHAPDIPVAEFFPSLAPHSLILPQQQIRRVTGAALSRKEISHLLDLKIGYAAVLKLHHHVHNQQRILIRQPYGIRREDLQHPDPLSKRLGKEIVQSLRNILRIHDLLEKSVVQKADPPHPRAKVQKILLLLLCPALKLLLQFPDAPDFSKKLLPFPDHGKVLL